MEQHDWEVIARDLYEALMQNRHSRGIHMDDFDIILDAMEKYENAAGFKPELMMWRVNYHKSMKSYWVVSCRSCNVPDTKLPTVEIARKWCRHHVCEPTRLRLADEQEAAALEE